MPREVCATKEPRRTVAVSPSAVQPGRGGVGAAERPGCRLLGGGRFGGGLGVGGNFVGRSGGEIPGYAEGWNAEADRFGAVVGYGGDRLAAPPLPPVPLKARGRVR